LHGGGGGSARRKAYTYTQDNTKRINTNTSLPRVGFEPTTPRFERAKTIHALDRATTDRHFIASYYEKTCMTHICIFAQIHNSQPLKFQEMITQNYSGTTFQMLKSASIYMLLVINRCGTCDIKSAAHVDLSRLLHFVWISFISVSHYIMNLFLHI
jgi:hypothetical protein